MKKTLTMISLLLCLNACAQNINITPFPSGGSKADGVVDLTYQFSELEIPVIDWEEAQKLAESKCKAWGYKTAEKFGGQRESCLDIYGAWGGCGRTQITVPYQCIQ